MTLEKLQAEMIAAMKNKNKTRKEAISTLIQSVKKASIDRMCKDNITESLVDEIILKEKKICQEMIDTCPADRPDIRDAYMLVMNIIDEFAPKLMTSADEIKDYVQNTLGVEFTKENRPVIMKVLKGKADMKIANSLF